ncbi:sucrose-6-phosphate hydrolase [Paenibacillus urinalis]|uniref:Sucrose-6-phosphate hydrolase n=1 Tax=Paenibacillus urinalis TaxID=521520 RepID=A0ABY7XDH1_9BACL|nr:MULTISPECIES: sucrose-6-phosphate hydrolase [Paenibacillus]WDH99189.1 sucrose-6-phosphate hydrolase [Paenibacillus urinalis]WDI02879.1 sucrose-6-phosphate hydrolase [Paenibacillus urinalis]GAK40380.1 sucrose-6-phosphate hydrolase [Paenibacillus sp. TCA20]
MDRELKYRRLDQAPLEEIAALQKRVKDSSWRQTYHIQPLTGLLNDPNGFAYYAGEYHLFYQWFPLGTYHGLKYWYHTASKDLAFWRNAGIAIEPSAPYDSLGAYSGSGIVKDEKLHLIYTGNTRDDNWNRRPYQCMAVMDAEGNITKLNKPLIDHVPEGYTEHFRDPKVWRDEDGYRCIIGAQRMDLTGTAVLYTSSNLVDWMFAGELGTGLKEFGYMWECPDYFELNGQGVLIFCPQGLEAEGDHYQNIYQSGYITGKPLNRETLEFEHGVFHELDRGFDYYAPQTMEDEQGRRILVAWMGQPEIGYPTDQHGWAHCLTLPRALELRNGKLTQMPVEELKKLRGKQAGVQDTLSSETKSYDEIDGIAYELICEFRGIDAEAVGVEIRVGETERTVIRYDVTLGKLTMDRSASGERIGSEYGTARSCRLDGRNVKFHLFVDTSSVELFINDGEEVFTSRIFPQSGSKGIRFFSNHGIAGLKVTKWDLTQAVNDIEGKD